VQEFSSVGRASVSKTEGRGFESPNSCHNFPRFLGVTEPKNDRASYRATLGGPRHDRGTIFLLLYPRLDSDTCDKSAKHNCQNVFPVHFTIFAQRSDVRNVVVRGLTASASIGWLAAIPKQCFSYQI
jgi:hypothetical protein